MPKVECSVVIDQPIDRVFTYVTNAANLINWQPFILDSQSDRRIGIGSRIEAYGQLMGRKVDMTTQVLEFVPNKRLVTQGVGKSFFTKMVYLFERVGDSHTKVSYTADFQPRGLLQLFGPMTVNRFRKEMADSFLRLKGVLEAEF